MSSMKFKAHLDTSHHGLQNPFKDADSLTGIHNAMVKCLFVVNRSFIHKGFRVPPQVTIERIQIWRAWRLCSGSSSTYAPVLIGVTGNISHSTANRSWQYSFSYNSQIKCFRTHVYMDGFCCCCCFFFFGMWNSCPKFVCTFHLHPVYKMHNIHHTLYFTN
jgi:hypothetical protein